MAEVSPHSLASFGFDPDFCQGLFKEVTEQLPAEKLRERLRQISAWRTMQAADSVKVDGLGQKIGEISARTFFRWQREFPGCWQDPAFVKKMLKDNPAMRAPGYRG